MTIGMFNAESWGSYDSTSWIVRLVRFYDPSLRFWQH